MLLSANANIRKIEKLKELGYDAIDVGFTRVIYHDDPYPHEDILDSEDWEKNLDPYIAKAKEVGLKIATTHLPYRYDYTDTESESSGIVSNGALIPEQYIPSFDNPGFKFVGWYTDSVCTEGNEFDAYAPLNLPYTSEGLRRGYEITIGCIGDYEIDFVCKKMGEKIYVQVTRELSNEDTIEREFRPLLLVKDNYPKYVISTDEFDMSRDGIKHMNILDFLIDEEI